MSAPGFGALVAAEAEADLAGSLGALGRAAPAGCDLGSGAPADDSDSDCNSAVGSPRDFGCTPVVSARNPCGSAGDNPVNLCGPADDSSEPAFAAALAVAAASPRDMHPAV